MERLTERNESGQAYYKKCFEEPCNGMGERDCDTCEHSYAACERLAEYEDLGITAEQVRELDRICTEKIQELTKYQKLEERLDNIFHGRLTLEKAVEEIELALVEPGSPHPVNAKILTYAEAAEWENYLEMKENGKRIQLPCDVGDIVYRINVGAENPVIEMRITNILISLAKGNRFRIGTKDAADGNEHYYDVSHIGKTLFLSKEEAEQHLDWE